MNHVTLEYCSFAGWHVDTSIDIRTYTKHVCGLLSSHYLYYKLCFDLFHYVKWFVKQYTWIQYKKKQLHDVFHYHSKTCNILYFYIVFLNIHRKYITKGHSPFLFDSTNSIDSELPPVFCVTRNRILQTVTVHDSSTSVDHDRFPHWKRDG